MNAELLGSHLPHIGKLGALLHNTNQTCCRRRRKLCVCRRVESENGCNFRSVASRKKRNVGSIDCPQHRECRQLSDLEFGGSAVGTRERASIALAVLPPRGRRECCDPNGRRDPQQWLEGTGFRRPPHHEARREQFGTWRPLAPRRRPPHRALKMLRQDGRSIAKALLDL